MNHQKDGLKIIWLISLACWPACGSPTSMGERFASGTNANTIQTPTSNAPAVDPNTADYSQPDTWPVVWSDEFSGPTLDFTKWEYEINCDGGGNNELECYTSNPNNVYIDTDGHLVIQVLKQTYSGQPYTSARLNSSEHADFLYGKFEISAKVPSGQGFWPAIWMLPTDSPYGGWPTSGELDIMEILGGNPNTLFGTAHFGQPYPNQASLGGTYVLKPGDFSQDFHTYSIIRTPAQVRWYVDNKLYYTLDYNSANWSPAPAWPFSQKFFLILNVAMGGNFPGPPDPNITSGQMLIDYVRVYAPAGTYDGH